MGSAALLIYEAFVIGEAVFDTILSGSLSPKIAKVLAVLFMREAVAWDGQRDLLGFGVALALVIAVLTMYLKVKAKH